MRWSDLLRMSSSNLKRRKLRTFLTVLGVVIGTASIVVMISLGLGMQQSMYEQIEESGGVNSITVTGRFAGQEYYKDGSQDDTEMQYITDDTVEMLRSLEHVKSAWPVVSAEAILKKGNYISYIQLQGITEEAMQNLSMELEPWGRYPEANATELELLFGNMIITNFYEEKSGKGYYESGELPDINLQQDKVFLILDQQAYFSSQQNSMGDSMGGTSQDGNSGQSQRIAKKHSVKVCGVGAGGLDAYDMHSYSVYCNQEKLIEMLKKEFRGRVIPGQPSSKSGKPYEKFVYTSVDVQADDINEVESLCTTIREMGYDVTSNIEWLNSMKEQFAMIQAVLGGIGAVSLFVAAIGIANTMMMSIYERTKEIGVIKVLGCGLKNIKQMFLLEAAFIGFFGGLIGNILSLLISFGLNMVVSGSGMVGSGERISYIPVWLILASMAFAVFVGMAAGYFPALRAMRLSPLAAIRNE